MHTITLDQIESKIKMNCKETLLLHKMEVVETRRLNLIDWMEKHGSNWYQLLPKAKRQMDAYQRYLKKMQEQIINLNTASYE